MEQTALRPKPMPGQEPGGGRKSGPARRPHAARRRGRRFTTALFGLLVALVLVLSGVGLVGALTAAVQSNFQQFACTAAFPPREGEISAMASALYLTDEEHESIRNAIRDLIGKPGRTAGPGNRRRFLAYFSVPISETE